MSAEHNEPAAPAVATGPTVPVEPAATAALTVIAPEGVPVLTSGDDLAAVLTPVLERAVWPDGTLGLRPGDVVVVSSKIVSKAEGRLVAARDEEERQAVIAGETVRVVAERARPDGGALRIVENHLGLVMAAAGVDTSDVPPGTALLLPEDPDASARKLRLGLHARTGVKPGVIVTDTFGRPWRRGLVDQAIGAAGVAVQDDRRGEHDSYGRELQVTVIAVADEIAAAAELVKGKATGRPVAVVRGMGHAVTDEDGAGARELIRTPEEDMFRRGVAEDPETH
ncbi:coenzyme F420-0:L-glutamate ligase/coenzyme F420-1:gamma-L-glutamate ligase [Bogoriella caseilytica]|uniref:Coenzyme F420-0:L-glutamate ligase/coenzyme F420-1:gamma-L-glutamate ligase n=1 Tax=Bogoriella caseilytica TaxID=56055 RepID=A0A3N2BFV5_9MICO|nr:coenzyme F420-0:L-glutamate ligase/coenzyme F420-1:gamma-L-glutamate ligase [Bogoriella caseilytica]